MIRIRTGWLVAALALSTTAGACKKSENKPASTATTTTPGAKAGTVAAGGANSPTQPDHRPRPISPATPWPTWKPDYSARSPSRKMNCAP